MSEAQVDIEEKTARLLEAARHWGRCSDDWERLHDVSGISTRDLFLASQAASRRLRSACRALMEAEKGGRLACENVVATRLAQLADILERDLPTHRPIAREMRSLGDRLLGIR